MPIAATLLEPEDLAGLPDSDGYELIDGNPREKHKGAESARIALTLGGSLLRPYVRQRTLGRVYGSQTGYRGCFPHAPRQIRKPDVSFVAMARLPDGVDPKGDFLIAPDLAVEVVSPNDAYEYIEQKVFDYQQAKVPLIWIVSPATKSVLVRRLDGTGTHLTTADALTGEGVIPGFECRVAEVFE